MARVLVTGIGGFIGKHVARELLAAGHDVRGTLRDAGRAAALRRLLVPLARGGTLSLAGADLLADAGWAEAMAGVDAVVHVASPFPLQAPRIEADVVRPAVEGTLRVLRAARSAGVRRFVQTSSTVAIAYGHAPGDHHFTAADWTVPDGPGTTGYARSKTLAERAARDFVARDGAGMHYTSINPGMVWGPLLDHDYGASAALIAKIVGGAYPALPRLQIMAVDVRDVALLHRLAVERDIAPGGRYIAVAGAPWLSEIGRALKDGLGAAGRKVPVRQLPDLVVRCAALFDKTLAEAVPLLGRRMTFDSGPVLRDFGLSFIPASAAALAMAQSLLACGGVR